MNCFFVIFVFFTIVLAMEEEKSPKVTLGDLLNKFQYPNMLINEAMEIRKKLITEGNATNKKKIKDSLDYKEYQKEFLAYTKFFDIDLNEEEIKNDSEKTVDINIIKNIVDNKFDALSDILKEKLQFDYQCQDIDSYHNLRFDIENKDFEYLKNMKIMTDNHSSKMFINKGKDTIFLGDLLDRHLSIPSNDLKISKNKNNNTKPSGSTIIVDEDEDEDEKNRPPIEKPIKQPINKFFIFLKYMYLMLYELTLQASFKIKLEEDKDNQNFVFKDLKYFYSLGNHECGIILQQDLEKAIDGSCFNIDYIVKLSRKIDKLTRFLLPTEIVFFNKESSSVYVFSHSGGMLLLPDNTGIYEYKYKDFHLSVYKYSLFREKYCIKQSLNNISDDALTTKIFVSKLAASIDININHSNFKQKSNPFIWCDFFDEVNSQETCRYDGGRYLLMNIVQTKILKVLYNILMQNYDIKNNFLLRIFRGHEHASNKLNLFLFHEGKTCYTVLDKDPSNKSCIYFYCLPPVCLDNMFAQQMPILSFLENNNLNYYIDQKANLITENNSNKDNLVNNSIKILPAFFQDYTYFKKCQELVDVLKNITKKISIQDDKKLNEFGIIDLGKKLKTDEEIFIDILKNVLGWKVNLEKKNIVDEGLDSKVAYKILSELQNIANFILYVLPLLSEDDKNKYLKTIDIIIFDIKKYYEEKKNKSEIVLQSKNIKKFITIYDYYNYFVNILFIIGIFNKEKMGFNDISGLIVVWSLLIIEKIYEKRILNFLFHLNN
jgi:hypothetical protein